jgi:hypothetical protein
VKGLALSRAASGLLRFLLHRVEGERDRIFLIEASSTDWQSLTFTGEQHLLVLRIGGASAESLANALTDGLADAEFSIPGHIVADIAAFPATKEPDGSILVRIEALTVTE